MTAPMQPPSGASRDDDGDGESVVEDTRILAALRDDIAANTHPEDRVPLSSRLVCDLITEVIRLRTITAAHRREAAASANPAPTPRPIPS